MRQLQLKPCGTRSFPCSWQACWAQHAAACSGPMLQPAWGCSSGTPPTFLLPSQASCRTSDCRGDAIADVHAEAFAAVGDI